MGLVFESSAYSEDWRHGCRRSLYWHIRAAMMNASLPLGVKAESVTTFRFIEHR